MNTPRSIDRPTWDRMCDEAAHWMICIAAFGAVFLAWSIF